MDYTRALDNDRNRTSEAKKLTRCCGLYCGLCNKYQSNAPSRCLGCRLGLQHSWCSIWNCCVKKNQFKYCTDCEQVFRCDIFLRRKVAEWIPAADNLRQIKEIGLDNWLKKQKMRQALLEKLLHDYNEGRSLSLFCKVCARMPIGLVNKAIEEAKEIIAQEKVANTELKFKARILKAVINDLALKANVDLSGN